MNEISKTPPQRWGQMIGAAMSAPSADELQEFDPASGAPSFRIAKGGKDVADRAVAAAAAAFPAWRDLRPIERGRAMLRSAERLRARAQYLAAIDRQETGRRMSVCLAEVETAAGYLEYYGGLVNAAAGRVIDLGAKYHSYTRHEPYGVVGVIAPWNSPMTQASRGFSPAIAMGNTVVLKPSEFTSAATLAMVEIMVSEAGLPPGVVNVVTGTGPDLGEALVRHPTIRKLSFTGSVRAAQAIGHIAADRILPLGLELGGKSANIVFADADLDLAVPGSVKAFATNSGQLCSAGTRLLVERSIEKAFVERLEAAVAALKVGNGEDDAIGPIITHAQYEKVRSYRDIARNEGARLFEGGNLSPGNPGWYVPPTVMSNLTPEMRVAKEEIFGPMLAVIGFDREDEAIRIANGTDYGLVAGLWTRDLGRAHRVAAALEAGQIFVNEYFAGGIETPFGGYKQSGYGREKGIEALEHYVQVKAVTVKL